MASLTSLIKRPVYFYTHTAIAPFGSGTHLRQFTNVRAYLDLGFQVEVVHITPSPINTQVIIPEGARCSVVTPEPCKLGLRQRLAYKLGFPLEAALPVLYGDRQVILDAVRQRERATPGAIHHFEYLDTANVAISLKREDLNLVWSCLDWESDRFQKLALMRAEIGKRKGVLEKLRRQYFAYKVEKHAAASCKLVLMIAENETRIFRENLGISHAELFPMSVPDETLPQRTRAWADAGMLRLLHLGSPDAMVGYYSLKFILGEVLPLIPDHI